MSSFCRRGWFPFSYTRVITDGEGDSMRQLRVHKWVFALCRLHCFECIIKLNVIKLNINIIHRNLMILLVNLPDLLYQESWGFYININVRCYSLLGQRGGAALYFSNDVIVPVYSACESIKCTEAFFRSIPETTLCSVRHKMHSECILAKVMSNCTEQMKWAGKALGS